MSPSSLVVLALTAGTLPAVLPDDWPTFGGPQRTGVSSERDWSSKPKPEPLWRTQLGIGYSSVAVAGKRLYTLGYDTEIEHDVVYCLDAETGAEQWVHAYPAKRMDLYHGGGTLTTPTVHGERVYVSEREGRLFCFDAKSGDVLWEKHPAKELDLDVPQWGFSASPVLVGADLILNYGQVIAFDPATGAVKWKTKKNYGDAYSTPVELQSGDTRALVVFAGSGLVLLAAGGQELAFQPWTTKHDVNAMTPLVFGQRVFISSGYDHGCALVDLSGKTPAIVWESKVMQNQMSGAVPWADHLYGFDDKVLKCIDLAGEERWRQRGLGLGALSIADGRLIVLSEDGELIVAKATPAAFEELARTKVFDGGTCWTVPVLANGIVYARNHAGELVALDHRQP